MHLIRAQYCCSATSIGCRMDAKLILEPIFVKSKYKGDYNSVVMTKLETDQVWYYLILVTSNDTKYLPLSAWVMCNVCLFSGFVCWDSYYTKSITISVLNISFIGWRWPFLWSHCAIWHGRGTHILQAWRHLELHDTYHVVKRNNHQWMTPKMS